MKKILILLAIVLPMIFVSCSKESILVKAAKESSIEYFDHSYSTRGSLEPEKTKVEYVDEKKGLVVLNCFFDKELRIHNIRFNHSQYAFWKVGKSYYGSILMGLEGPIDFKEDINMLSELVKADNPSVDEKKFKEEAINMLLLSVSHNSEDYTNLYNRIAKESKE